ncbi:MAG: hypothetical protein Kow0098_25830 [Ignavibacteriaceae bacterium]
MIKLTFVILLSAITLYAQDVKFDSLVNTGIKQIYNIKFDQAGKSFRQLIADYPDHPAGRFFLAMIDWWKILMNPDDESHDDIFYQKLEDVIFHCDQMLEKDPDNVDALFFKGGSVGFRGRLRAFRESWLKAADDGREALPIVERAAQLDPGNPDVKLGFGIYNYYAAVIPEEYPLIKPLMIFFPSGDKKLGIKQLTETAFSGRYARYEAQYFLTTLYFRYENNPYKADEFASMLVAEFPDNPVFQRWLGRIKVKQGKYAAADSIFSDVIRKYKENYSGYDNQKGIRESYYYIGVHQKNIGNVDSALVLFRMCSELSEKLDGDSESGFRINSEIYIAQILDQKGEDEAAIEIYERLLDMDEYGNSHQIAENNLKRLRGKSH